MALINCPECGKEISDKAEACIHCGYPILKIKEQEEKKIICKFNEDDVDIAELIEYGCPQNDNLKNPIIIMDILVNKYRFNWTSVNEFTEFCMHNDFPKEYKYRTIDQIKDIEDIIEKGNKICFIGNQDLDLGYLIKETQERNCEIEVLIKELYERKDVKITYKQAEKVISFILKNDTIPKGVDTTIEELETIYDALPEHKILTEAIKRLREDNQEYNEENLKKYINKVKERELKICVINGKKFNFDEGFTNDVKSFVYNNEPIKLHKTSKNLAKMTGLSNEEATDLLVKFIENGFEVPEKYREYNSIRNANQVVCPKCGSTAITAGQRGYTLLTGFLGSNKTVNRCANCGHTWKPGR